MNVKNWPKEGKYNYTKETEQCGRLEDIISCGYSLTLNMNTNVTEIYQYNTVVSKFVEGKGLISKWRVAMKQDVKSSNITN